MASNRVTFGEWLPDQPGVIGALTTAKNCYPRAVGYGPFPQEADYSAAADLNLNNVVAARDTSGNTKVFAGSDTKLYTLDSGDLSLDDVSGTTYTSASRWRFTQFGNRLIAGNEANTLQGYDLTSTGDFANLASDAPKAKFVTVVRDFVVTGYQNSYPFRVQWSGINNETTWAASGTTQADSQDIPDGGAVQGVTGGEFGLVLLERSIFRMSYLGTPLIFQFDNIARNLGCYEPNSVIQWQQVTYFLGDDGFYACDGQNVVNIGAEKVNRYFFTSLQEAEIGNMSAAVDPERNLIIWGYPTIDTTYRLLIYHIPTKRWSYADTGVNRVCTSATPSITLEGLDSFSASIDALSSSLDSRIWLGGKINLAGVSGAKIITFSGSPKTAIIDTSDIEVDSANKSMITLARPIVDNGSGSVAVDSRDLLNETVSFPAVTAANSENRVGLRSFGRYHRLRVTPTGADWKSAIGVDLEIQRAGMR
jgi:hypothetical protein